VGELPSGGFVASHEFERAEREQEANDDAEHADPARGGGGLGEGDAGQRGPRSGEEVAQVLADSDVHLNSVRWGGQNSATG
jgi:hypothetical protein